MQKYTIQGKIVMNNTVLPYCHVLFLPRVSSLFYSRVPKKAQLRNAQDFEIVPYCKHILILFVEDT